MNEYRERDILVQDLGFSSYRSYLESDLWKTIRARVFEEVGDRCNCCGRIAQAVHHEAYTYGILSGEDIEYMVPLCNRCHRKAETTPRGKKRSFEEVGRALACLKASRGKRSSNTREL